MLKKLRIAGYCRRLDDAPEEISVGVENQKMIIKNYVKEHFANGSLDIYEDKDKSG